MTFSVPNFSGMLFRKGVEATPFSTIIGANPFVTDHNIFTCGQYYQAATGSQPAISEEASLIAPTPQVVTRTQLKNTTQIFHKSVAVSYAKESNMGMMAATGINVAGQEPNPQDELLFQVDRAMAQIAQEIEYSFLNGVYAEATADNEANKTRGLLTAITTNHLNVTPESGTGPMLTRKLINKAILMIANQGGETTDLVLGVPAVQLGQLDEDARTNGLTNIPAERTINGIAVTTIITPYGVLSVRMMNSLPAGTAVIFSPSVMHPVFQPTPGRGNFFLERLAIRGAAEEYQIFGQVGLDSGPEWLSAKITGLSTAMPGDSVG
jgi:hypothetical protein